MPTGLVRDNNLSDLPNRNVALNNLGISITDVERIRGAAFPYGVRSTDIQRIVGSSGNFQQQLDTLSSGINNFEKALVSGAYVLKAGDTIAGTWTNTDGYIQASGLYNNGVQPTPSTDALFSHNRDGNFEITTSVVRLDKGVTVDRFIDHNNIIVSGALTPNVLYPITINGVSYNIEAARP